MTAAPILPAPKRRRRPALLAAGIVLAVVGGLAAYALAASMSTRTAVVVAASDIPWGATLTATDLVEADIAGDPVLAVIPWQDRSTVIGQRAAADIHRGALVGPADLMTDAIPPEGKALVGVAVKPGQQPATVLAAGQNVLIAHTTADGRTSADDPGAGPVAAVVFTVSDADAGGGRTVDVFVAEADAPQVAAWSAAGAASIIEVAGR
jgi:hypothetical protein